MKWFASIRGTIGRKLMALILTPILTAAFVAVNAMLPEGGRLNSDQVGTIVSYLIGLAAAFIFGQAAADVAAKNAGTQPPAK